MANGSTDWQISGEYFETCSCDYICPCPTTGFVGPPTKGSCTFAMVFHVDQGRFGNVNLDGLNFALLGYTPEEMIKGNWSVGLITDERASQDQQQALLTIVSGQAGGPLAALAPLIGNFLGVESRPIQIQREGMRRSVSIPDRLDQALEGVAGANQAEPMYLDNTPHPASARLALAKASRSHVHAFGLDWDDESGQNNGHFAPFNWRSA